MSDKGNEYYLFRLKGNENYIIPKICPVCLKSASNKVKLRARYIASQHFVTFVRRHFYQSEIDIYSCCSKRQVKKNIIIVFENNDILFIVKNRKYADQFSILNDIAYEATDSLTVGMLNAQKGISMTGHLIRRGYTFLLYLVGAVLLIYVLYELFSGRNPF